MKASLSLKNLLVLVVLEHGVSAEGKAVEVRLQLFRKGNFPASSNSTTAALQNGVEMIKTLPIFGLIT